MFYELLFCTMSMSTLSCLKMHFIALLYLKSFYFVIHVSPGIFVQ